ncbi:MAG: hypothetical protein JOZ51_10185 [Chloroflexi bacterium]|nr:hypothetical protein [Chloroflexota bacterium]
MPQFREHRIAAQNVKSLCWHDHYLVDWVGGGNIYHLDGSIQERHVNYAYRFDAAIVSPSGDFACIYERLGTKGLLLDHGKILREINRSFYQAHVYEYPVTFIQLADGRELLAHCPEEYRRIDIEDARTGERLTSSTTREPQDMFHSCLACSPSGRWLLSAGWVWAPWDVVALYDIPQALSDPTLLDKYGVAPETSAEVYAAAFSDADTVVLLTSEETNDDDDPLGRAGPHSIAYYDLLTREYRSIAQAEEVVGKLMPVGQDYIVGFYEYPKLFDSATGKVLHRWPDLPTGTQTGSIQWHIDSVPPVAIDLANKRFAVAGADAITVIEIVAD